MVTFLFVLSACTDRQPVAPNAPAIVHHEEGELQWVSLGSAEVGTTGTIGALPWTSTGIYVPAGVEARMWLRGKLSVSYNQAFSRFCSLGFYAPIDCHGNGFDGHQVGGAGIDIYYLAADIRIRDGATVREIGFGVPRGSDGDPVEAGVTGPGIIEVSRSGMDMPFTWQDLGTDQRYNVTGTQTLEVEALGRVDACGGVVLAGATGAEPHTDCVPVPPKPEPKPRMKCTDKNGRENVVVRGESMICRVVLDPDTSWLPASEWRSRFVAVTDVTTIPNPIPHPLPTRTLDVRKVVLPGPQNATSWGGRMAVSTVVEATVTASGTTYTPSSQVSVEARSSFPGGIVYPPLPTPEFTKVGLLYPPVSSGHPELGDGVLGLSSIPPLVDAGVDAGSGPNENWWFLDHVPQFLSDPTKMWIKLNPALEPDDPFFRAQRGSGNLVWGRPMCDHAFMVQAARQTRAHEIGHLQEDQRFFETASALIEQATFYDDPDHPAGKDFSEQLLSELSYARYLKQADWDARDHLLLTCDFNTNL